MKDKYWELLNHTRDKKEGPDGIKVFNAVNQALKKLYSNNDRRMNQSDFDNQVLRLTTELMELKIKNLNCVEQASAHW